MGEPVSWLRLERYHLGELGPAERAEIAEHLAACEACRGCLARIELDDAVALPPLPAPRPESVAASRWRRGAAAFGALALAAAALLGLGRGWRGGTEVATGTGGGVRVKGDAVGFALVRDDGAWIDEAGGAFRDGDRFKAVVSCPPGLEATFDLVVLDASGASFPLAPAQLACGNGVPLPGAFRLTGRADETVCLVWSEGAGPDREALAASGVGAVAGRAACKRLRSLPE